MGGFKFGSAIVAAALFGGATAYEGVWQRIGKNYYKAYLERYSNSPFATGSTWTATAPSYQIIKSNNIDWKLYVETVFNEDTGYSSLRIQHYLVAPIFKDDQIIFELAFYSKNQAGNIATTGISFGEDFCRCTLSINTSDNRFWTSTLEDGYYQCTGNTAGTSVPNICDWKFPNDYNSDTSGQIEVTEDNDWAIPTGWEDSATDNTNY